MRLPLKYRLIGSFILVFIVMLFGFLSFFKGHYQKMLIAQNQDKLKTVSDILLDHLSENDIKSLQSNKINITVFTFEKKVLYHTLKDEEPREYTEQDLKLAFTTRIKQVKGDKIQVVSVTRKLKNTVVRLELEENSEMLEPFISRFYEYAVLGFSFLLLLGFIFMENLLGPLKAIINFAKEFGKKNYEARINHFGKGELQIISQSLNQMAQMVDSNYKERKKRQALIEILIFNLPLGLALLDEEGNIEVYNPKLEIAFDTKIRAKKKYYENFYHSKIVESVKKCYDEEHVINTQIQLVSTDQEKAIYDLTCYYIRGKVIIVTSDLTEKEKLNRLKEQFISDVTHEFKTPISIIMGYMEILDEQLTEENKYYFGKIRNSLDRLLEIINDLIRLEKIEYANLFGDFKQINLNKPLKKAIEVLSPAAERKKMNIKVLSGDKAIFVKGIEEIIYYCFYNLMDNAIKYYDKEGDDLTIDIAEVDDMVQITVCDSGPGIPRQSREDIFRRFYRLSKGRESAKGAGSGLGLSIVREAVRFHHGKVYCRDNPKGRGTCFIIFLPKK